MRGGPVPGTDGRSAPAIGVARAAPPRANSHRVTTGISQSQSAPARTAQPRAAASRTANSARSGPRTRRASPASNVSSATASSPRPTIPSSARDSKYSEWASKLVTASDRVRFHSVWNVPAPCPCTRCSPYARSATCHRSMRPLLLRSLEAITQVTPLTGDSRRREDLVLRGDEGGRAQGEEGRQRQGQAHRHAADPHRAREDSRRAPRYPGVYDQESGPHHHRAQSAQGNRQCHPVALGHGCGSGFSRGQCPGAVGHDHGCDRGPAAGEQAADQESWAAEHEIHHQRQGAHHDRAPGEGQVGRRRQHGHGPRTEHADRGRLSRAAGQVQGEQSTQHRDQAHRVPVRDRVGEADVPHAGRGGQDVGQRARDEPDHGHRQQGQRDGAQHPAQAPRGHRQGAEQRQRQQVHQGPVELHQRPPGRPGPGDRGQHPGRVEAQSDGSHHQAAAGAGQRVARQGHAQDQRESQHHGQDTVGAREEPARVEADVRGERAREGQQGAHGHAPCTTGRRGRQAGLGPTVA